MKKSELKYQCLEENTLEKGGEYCFLAFPWEELYEELYNCLEEEGLPRNAQFCDQKFTYL